AGLHDLFERVALELHVLPAGLNQLGQLVVALLEQHVDVGPGLGNVVLQPDQAVIDDDAIQDQRRRERAPDEGDDHESPRVVPLRSRMRQFRAPRYHSRLVFPGVRHMERSGAVSKFAFLLVTAALAGCTGQQMLNTFTPEHGYSFAQNLPYNEARTLTLDI